MATAQRGALRKVPHTLTKNGRGVRLSPMTFTLYVSEDDDRGVWGEIQYGKEHAIFHNLAEGLSLVADAIDPKVQSVKRLGVQRRKVRA